MNTLSPAQQAMSRLAGYLREAGWVRAYSKSKSNWGWEDPTSGDVFTTYDAATLQVDRDRKAITRG